jgi:hypothetical protein
MVSTATDAGVRLPLTTVAAWTAAPALLIALIAFPAAWFTSGPDALVSVALAAVGVLIGAAGGWSLFALGGTRSPGAWSLVIVYAQAARMLLALVVGGSLFFLFGAEPIPFWATFLIMLLVMLAVEVVCSVKWIRTAGGSPAASERLS